MSEQVNNDQIKQDTDPAVAMLMDSINPVEETPVQSAEGDAIEGDQKTTDDTPADVEKVEPPAGETVDPIEKTPVVDESKQPFDANKYLEQSSEGLFKSEDDYKSALVKVKEYDALQKENENLKAEKESIFANETIKTQNRLIKEGKTDEQISEFLKLSKVDIATLAPKEVLIQREITNGHTRAIAEKLVERKYGLDKLSFNEEVLTEAELATNKEELELAEAIMKTDAEPVRKQMEEQFLSLKNEVSASEKALKEAASIKAYKTKLEPFAEKLQMDFPKKLVVGDDSTGLLSYDLPKDFIDSVKEDAIEFFLDREVSPESVEEFVTAKKALWLYSNQKEILNHFKAQVEADTEKKVRAEFENPQGLPKPGAIPVVQNKSIDDQLMALAND